VAYYRRLNRSSLVRSAALLSAVVLLLALAPMANAQRVLNENLESEGTAQPIELFADQVSTWTEAGQQVFLLQGGVVVTQGINNIHSSDAVVWVDMPRFQTERVLHVIVYGENPLTLERDKKSDKAEFGYVRLATTNKVDIKPFKAKLAQQDQTLHPVYQRALMSRPAGMTVPLRKQEDTASARPPVDPQFRQVGATEPRDVGPIVKPVEQTFSPAYFQPLEPRVEALGGPGAVAPPAPPIFSPNPPAPVALLAPVKLPPRISVRPGTNGSGFNASYEQVEPGLWATIITGGVTILITNPSDKPGNPSSTIDMEADRIVIWTRGGAPNVLNNGPATQSVDGGAHEIYLAGHVEVRSRTVRELETIRADELYYDVRRGVAVARKADLEIQSGALARPVHFVTDELLQVNPKFYKMRHASGSASILPSDPGLKFDVDNLEVREFQKERSYLWGMFPGYDKDGKRIVDTERIFNGQNFVVRLEEVPIFYFPFYRANVEKPLGPLESINASYNRIFGAQLNTTWDLFDLLNLPRPDGHRWRLMLDYLTARGPGIGTQYEFQGKDLFSVPSKYTGMLLLYGMSDRGDDLIGGGRGTNILYPDALTNNPITHPTFRGWANGKINVQELPDGFTVLGQFSVLSDRNFLEQYYANTYLNEMNQDTFLYVKQQQANWSWSIQAQVGTQPWLTQTDWLPRLDASLLGQTFLDDWVVYSANASAGYAQLRPTTQVPLPYLPTDVRASGARLDFSQEVSVPFYVGPFKIAPYLKLDTAYYSEDVNGDGRGRLVGGAGVRWNLPLSKLYPDIQSELFNLNGIYHKINLTGNYYTAQASSGVNNFPQFDRLNDDSTDQTLRDFRPVQTLFNPGAAAYLTSSNLFNPQNYAIRRLIDTNIDTLDTIDVLQLAINQRWQTKRGFPGNEHVVDWMTLNIGVSIFPHSQRDNYGNTFGIFEYDWTWNIGDRTALTSSGWFEPFNGGPRAFDLGVVINRPDTTNFYLGYRQIDPLNSKAVIGSVTYPLSAKYAMTASTVWDFGNHISSYSIFLSRMGTDVMVNFGVSYNSTVNTFGIAFEVLPNLTRPTGRSAGLFPMPMANIDPLVNVH
jgi:lipopolysaccharide export system protein LptA